MIKYADFIANKAQLADDAGFRPTAYHDFLFDFQRELVEWATRKGRAALFADCGLGKTAMQLAWADNVVRHTGKPVLILTPLAVAQQTVREAVKFGIEINHSLNVCSGINITNYERLHYFEAQDFAGTVCDESAILKSFDGVRRKAITEFMRRQPYRLLCTATPSPNEYVELGTSSEALGYLGYMDMLSRFFKNDQGNSIKPTIYRHAGRSYSKLDDNAKWRFKGHAETPFWQWVVSWARALRRPSDLGFGDDGFILPLLEESLQFVSSRTNAPGFLFSLPAVGLSEQRAERRRTIEERCEMAAALVHDTRKPAAIWCHLNDEGNLLEKLVPDCVQVSGADSDEEKEEKFLAFASGKARVLVTKHRIGAWGLNFQHCAHTISFPTHSYEEYYQSVRRFWRFGQRHTVRSEIIATEGEKDVLSNLQRKSAAADRMFTRLVELMNDAQAVRRSIDFTKSETVPTWL